MSKKSKMGNMLTIILALTCVGGLSACTTTSAATVTPVKNFEIERYLGDWYEIGRFDFTWEKNMKNVHANYSLNKDGTIKVTNSGYDYKAKKDKKFSYFYANLGVLAKYLNATKKFSVD